MKATFLLRLSLFTILCLPFAPLFCAIDVDVNIYAVGQGNGVLVKGGGHAMLIDAGSSASRLTALFHNRAFRHGRLEGEKENFIYECRPCTRRNGNLTNKGKKTCETQTFCLPRQYGLQC